jgi:hypothetical protein
MATDQVWKKLTTKDLIVVPPEVCQLGWSVVEFIPVGSQDKPGRRKHDGSSQMETEKPCSRD